MQTLIEFAYAYTKKRYTVLQRGYEFRIFPTPGQQEVIDRHIEAFRFTYNYALGVQKYWYEAVKDDPEENCKYISVFDMGSLLRVVQSSGEYPILDDIASHSIANAVVNADRAFKNFFRRCKQGGEKPGFPKFKGKRHDGSYQIPDGTSVDFSNETISITKIKNIPAILHRKFEGKIKTVTIKRNSLGQYFIVLLIETTEEVADPLKFDPDKTVGIDLGLKDFAIFSTGRVIKNPRFKSVQEKRLKRLQKQLSRKKKGSKNQEKARLKVAQLHARVRNQRQDFLHQLSASLTQDPDYNAFVFENLDIKGMNKTKRRSKAVHDVSWATFLRFMAYKAEKEGKRQVVVDRYFPSSKICNACHYQIDELPLRMRHWQCPQCGVENQRDINAAKNIRDEGVRLVQKEETTK